VVLNFSSFGLKHQIVSWSIRHGEHKANLIVWLLIMPVRSCKVTIEDMDGVRHTVDVTAASLYEAVALGMAAIRTDEWVSGIAQGLNPVTVQVTNVPVKHEVKLMDFTKWLDRVGGSPREMTDRKRIRTILGMEKANHG
jgi:hypothetical protein